MKDDSKDGSSSSGNDNNGSNNSNNNNGGKMKNNEKHETYTHIKKRKFSMSSPKLEFTNDDTTSPPSTAAASSATVVETNATQQPPNIDCYSSKCNNRQALDSSDSIKSEHNQRQQQQQQFRLLQLQQQQQQHLQQQQQQQYRQHDETTSNLSSSSSSPTGSVSSPESRSNSLNHLANLNAHPYFSPPYHFINRSNSANQNTNNNTNNVNSNNALNNVNNVINNNSDKPGSPQRRHSDNFLQFHQGPQPITPPPPAPQISAAELSMLTEVSATKNGTFQCTLCQKQFGYKNGLIRHVRLTHVGEKPYQCNICNRRFGYKHILMEHQNLHFGNRPYACVQCDKRFAARSNLIQHRTVHKRPYNCSLCNKRFDREDQLKKHLFAHPQVSVIACSSCDYTASSHSDYNRHLSDVHRSNVKDSPVSHYNDHNDDDDDDDDRDNENNANAMPKIGGHYGESNLDGVSKNNHNNGINNSPDSDKNQKKDNFYRECTTMPSETNNDVFSRHSNQEFDFQNVTVKKEIPESSDNIGAQQLPSSAFAPKSFEEQSTAFGNQQTARLNNEWIDSKQHGQKNVSNNKQLSENKDLFGMWAGQNSQPQSNQQQQRQQQQQVQLSTTTSTNHCQLSYIDDKPGQHLNMQAALPGIHEVFSKKNQLGSLPSFSHFIPTSNNRPQPQHQDSSQQHQQPFISQELFMSTHQQMIQQQQLHIDTYSNNQNQSSRQIHQLQSTSQQQQSHLLNFQSSSNQMNFQDSPPISSTNQLLNSLLPTNSICSSSLHQRPTAQLPPITNSTRHTKDQAIQHSVNLNGFPSLDEVLSYYVGQGRLFKCQHCNILFFERGMYFLHSSLHSSPNPWQCSICHKVCSDKNEFTLHFVNQQHNS